jgi:HTH-type transcriptional regulator, sugar sensing transcriptional regulator
MEQAKEILNKIGLTGQESRVYLALLEFQEAQTGLICKTTNIPSSNIYKILDSLMEKGLVSFRVQNNIKIFIASTPDSLNELFFEKQKKLEEERKQINELISHLNKKEILQKPQSHYKYFEGDHAVRSMWYELNNLIKTMNKNQIERIYGSKKGTYEHFIPLYNEHHKIRVKQKIKYKLILSQASKPDMKRKRGLTEIRCLPLENDGEWGVLGDYVFIQYLTGKIPRAFLIKDEKFARMYEQVFDQLWQLAKS